MTHLKTFRFRPSGGKEHRGLCDLLMKHKKDSRGFSPSPPSPLILFYCIYFLRELRVKMFTPTCLEGVLKRFLEEKKKKRSVQHSEPILPSEAIMIKTKAIAVICFSWYSNMQSIQQHLKSLLWKLRLKKQTRERKERSVWNFELGLSSGHTHCLRGEASHFLTKKSQLLIIL